MVSHGVAKTVLEHVWRWIEIGSKLSHPVTMSTPTAGKMCCANADQQSSSKPSGLDHSQDPPKQTDTEESDAFHGGP